MRIISGWARGRKLAAPPGKSRDIRPTSDRAREALFSILGPAVRGSVVLDLFAGTGALGLEALSRGAEKVTLVDFSHTSLKLISRNLSALQDNIREGSVTVIRHDLRKGLPPELAASDTRVQFDLIFLDPPYSMGLSLKILEWLSNSSLLQENCTVIAEERSSEKLPEICGRLLLTDQRTYGDTGFWLYSLQPLQHENA